MRQDEIAQAAREAAEKAKQDRENGRDPADSETHDQVNPNGSNGDNDEWWNDAQFYADAFSYISIGTGLVAVGLGLAALAFPPLARPQRFSAPSRSAPPR